MEENKRWALRINRKNLVKDLCIEEIENHMIYCGVIDDDDFEKIKNSGRNRKERAVAFLDHLGRRGSAAFDDFCDALQEKQQFLSHKLKADAEKLAKKVGKGAKVEIDAQTLQAILRDNDNLHQAREELQQLQHKKDKLHWKNDRLSESLARARKRSQELADESDAIKMEHSESIKSMHTLLQVVNEKKSQKEEVERDVEGLEERLYQMEENLNIKEEKIKWILQEKQQVEERVISERRMVNNLRGQLDTLKKDIDLMKQDMTRLRRDRDAARKTAEQRGGMIQRLQHELTLANQLKKNCESIIRFLNGSVQTKEDKAQQAQADLSNLLQQYLELKQSVS